MAAITSNQISFSQGGRIIHICSRLRNPESPLRATCSLQAHMQSRSCNHHHSAYFPDEKTEVKRLDQAHTAKHVKNQAQTQGNCPKIVCFYSTPTGSGGLWSGSNARQKQTIFTFKLKKVRKTTRTFSYDLNQIPYDYIVGMKNRFKGLGLVALRTVDGGLQHCMGGGHQNHLKKNTCRKAKWLPEEAL